MRARHALIALGVLLVALACTASDCQDKTETKHERQTEQLLAEADRQIGLPKIVNFNERKLATLIMEMRDKEDLPTYTYLVNEHTGQLVFLFHSIGFGLPYGTQMTNPEKREYESATLPQAEPNGLYMPASAEATWILKATKTGPRPVYVEPRVIISPEPLEAGGRP